MFEKVSQFAIVGNLQKCSENFTVVGSQNVNTGNVRP
jgi:hypothetical protein